MKPGVDIIRLDLPADAQYLAILSSVIEIYLVRVNEISDREMTVYNLKLAAQECCTNIIDHAYGGQASGRIEAHLTIQHEPRRLVIEFHDTGRSVEPNFRSRTTIGDRVRAWLWLVPDA